MSSPSKAAVVRATAIAVATVLALGACDKTAQKPAADAAKPAEAVKAEPAKLDKKPAAKARKVKKAAKPAATAAVKPADAKPAEAPAAK